MASSPLNETGKKEVDLCTPTENLHKHCQEITPDNPIQPTTGISFGAKKTSAVGHYQKLSKRKLFELAVGQTGGDENVSETVYKKKLRSDDATRTEEAKDDQRRGSSGDCPPGKRPLTERQQLAFLLEATSSHESHEDENNPTFTKIKSRKRIKRNGKCVNPRVYRRNERGETPLHLAAIKGDVDSLRKLFKDGAEVGVKDYAGWTALHEACNHGNLAAAKLLVKYGAQVNVPGFEGDTPLHDAVVNNHVQVVDMLLSCGANPHQTNMKRKKPLDLISSKEMCNTFNLHGVQHASFEKKKTEILKQDVVTSSNYEKPPKVDSQRLHTRGSILGNEIQRKETLGESRMEKPVMYICKLEPRNEELTICTTQVTSYGRCSDAVQGGDGENGEEGKEEKRKLFTGNTPPRQHDETLSEVGLGNDTSSQQQVKKLDITEVKKRRNKLTLLTSQSEDLTTTNETTEISGNGKVAVGDHEENVDWHIEDNPSRSQETEHLENEQVLNDDDDEEKDSAVMYEPEKLKESGTEGSPEAFLPASSEKRELKTKVESPPITQASEDPPSAEAQKEEHCISTQLYSERSSTPEIDESIALEVLSTGLFSAKFAQYDDGTSIRQEQGADRRFRRESSEDHPEIKNIRYIYGNISPPQGDEGASGYKDDTFLDVEGLELDQPSLEVRKSEEQLQVLQDFIGSASNCNKEKTTAKDETSKIIEQTENTFISSDVTPISGRFVGIKHNAFNRWQFETTTKDPTISADEATIRYNPNDLQRWRLEKKSKGRKIGGGNKTFIRKDKISRRKSGISRNLEDTTRYVQPQKCHSSRISEDSQRLEHGAQTVVTTTPAVSWQSLVAAGKCRLAELSIPGYDEFLIKTKNYELAKDSSNYGENTAGSTLTTEDKLKYKNSKGELLKKQRSELDKLQLCMEQEIVRFYKNQAYSSLKCNQPASVCSAIYWQNLSKKQLENEKNKLFQQCLPKDQNSPFDHREIIKKYDNLKTLMANRHKHEQQSLDAVAKQELES